MGLVGLITVSLGALYAVRRPLSGTTQSVFQHVAAGAVFAGLVVDALARIIDENQYLLLSGGGLVLGTLALLGVRLVSDRSGGAAVGLVATTIVDILVDGLLLGMSITTGELTALVFTIALVPELVLLGATLAQEFGSMGWSDGKRLAVPVAVGVGILGVSYVGMAIQLVSPTWALFAFGFGAMALAYFVMEELLREAHGQKANFWIAATFFAGFLPFYIAGAAVA